MSDTESNTNTVPLPSSHPNLGGKSLATIERPRYKSWRKKYRKMRHTFDQVLEDNKRLFKEEQKLEGIAKRLREELDGLLELSLDLNSTPSLPPHLRFNLSLPHRETPIDKVVRADITPEDAHQILANYRHAVAQGQLPTLDLHVVRELVDARLAAQGVETFEDMERSIPHPDVKSEGLMAEYGEGEDVPGYLTSAQESAYLAALDAKIGAEPYPMIRPAAAAAAAAGERHWADLTPREVERQSELLNPQSQHNWLRIHGKTNAGADKPAETTADDEGGGGAGAEAGMFHTFPNNANGGKVAIARSPANANNNSNSKRASNLAKQVGDRALERAKDSPGANTATDDEFGALEEVGGGGRRKKDGDATYKGKSGKGGGGKAKRKRSGEDVGTAVGGKRVKVEGGE